jgi:hypothetical protein
MGVDFFITSHESQDVHDKMEKLYIQNIPISLFPFCQHMVTLSNQLQKLHDLNPRIIKWHKLHLYTNFFDIDSKLAQTIGSSLCYT